MNNFIWFTIFLSIRKDSTKDIEEFTNKENNNNTNRGSRLIVGKVQTPRQNIL
jgi:hypothetical protein